MSVSMLLYVHRDRANYLGREAQDAHLFFHAAPELFVSPLNTAFHWLMAMWCHISHVIFSLFITTITPGLPHPPPPSPYPTPPHPFSAPKLVKTWFYTCLQNNEEVVSRFPLLHNLLPILKLHRLQSVSHGQPFPLVKVLCTHSHSNVIQWSVFLQTPFLWFVVVVLVCFCFLLQTVVTRAASNHLNESY